MTTANPSNDEIAGILERIAELLESRGANPFRVQAYRHGADTARSAERALAEVVREDGPEGLTELPGIGEGLATTIAEYVRTGRSSLRDRLEGDVPPEDLFGRVPGIGETLSRRLVEELDVHTLEELERAAHDGRLEQVEGFSPGLVENVRVALAGMLSRSAQRRARRRTAGREAPQDRPDVATLLDVDAEYRRGSEAGDLPTIAPRRHNPERKSWLPVLRTERGDWGFTALYSNTARAHQQGKTRDWVVLYYRRGGHESQATVVTATRGPLQGRRVVRGREAECRAHYEEAPACQ